ncbi:MAG TPA: diaminopimelate decarboxylase [Chloroflexota bacterium]
MNSVTLQTLLPDCCHVSESDTRVGRHSLADLAARFGTPLYIYDAATLRSSARTVIDAFAPLKARVSYASKACAILGVLRVICQSGLGLDAVSGGELHAGLKAGFEPKSIHLHGNVKTDTELDAAVCTGVHAVVVDSLAEVERLDRVCSQLGAKVGVMIRLSLPVEAETHPHLQTSGAGTKFGVLRSAEEEAALIRIVLGSCRLRFMGLHVHLGSQITDVEVYRQAASQMAAAVSEYATAGLESEELSMGGGWAVPYVPGDTTLDPRDVAGALGDTLATFPDVRPAVEPGRALVARSALALYRVASIKHRFAGRIISVDGGMGDNPRPALYGARYTAFLSRLPLAESNGPADVVGRYCESGDVLARQVSLPEVREGDMLCVPVSGAYQLSMASSYNLVPPPAAILVDGDEVTVIRRRPTPDQLLEYDS